MTYASMKTKMKGITALFLTLLVATSAWSQRAIQPQGGYWVHDEVGVLSNDTKAQLERFIQNEEDSTSNQIAVYIIKSLDGEDIDDYAFKVFKDWKIGTAQKDNGVLMLIAIDDRMMRIEV